MARAVNQRITHIKASSLASFQGAFGSLLGLGVAILHSIDSVAKVAESTNSVLRGMAFGLASGVVSIIVVPLVYFAIGWIIGYLQAIVFNAVLATSGGLVVEVQEDKE